MPLETQLLRSSFETVIEREPVITARFYEILFARFPQAQALFGRNSTVAQQQMLQQSLVAVIHNLDDPDWLRSTLHALGAKHVDYGVTEPMFDWVGAALLATLEEILGDDWNADVARAWQDAYAAIAELMIAGMAAGRSQTHVRQAAE
jgi:hemoglobin-like flavoprotein